MPNKQDTIRPLLGPKIQSLFSMLYGRGDHIIQKQRERYRNLIEKHSSYFPDSSDIHLFSTPGRTELGGNHTDHNGGVVLAASVNLDSIAAAARTEDDCITLYSEGYPAPFEIFLDDLEVHKDEQRTTASLIRGVAARFKELGYSIGGFNACISSDIHIGRGLSSSASIEVLLCTIINILYNGGAIPEETLAMIGQYAENVYFNKPSGLMDQLACALGGIVSIDFKDIKNPAIQKVCFDFNALDYKMLVVDSGGNHADLTEEYSSVAKEMQSVAQALGGKVLRDIDSHDVFSSILRLRPQVGDRAILRAFHFFADNLRVLKQIDALEREDFDSFLCLVNESGKSSCRWLQNSYSIENPTEQGIPLALMLTENYLRGSKKGACRVHGGGFAGTIQVFMPNELLDEYVRMMDAVFGKGSVMQLDIRPIGTICIEKEA